MVGGRTHANSEACSGTEDLFRGLLPYPGRRPKIRTEVESISSATRTRQHLFSLKFRRVGVACNLGSARRVRNGRATDMKPRSDSDYRVGRLCAGAEDFALGPDEPIARQAISLRGSQSMSELEHTERRSELRFQLLPCPL